MDTSTQESLRAFLLQEVRHFVNHASKLAGVERIALIGSLVIRKNNPKDADVLVTITPDVDIDALAVLGRRMKGRGQSRNSGADIFLCNPEGEYFGRTCSFRECHPRVRCSGTQCFRGTRICDDFDVVCLNQDLIREPPLILWPSIEHRQPLPEDVEQVLISQL